jgi:hypothetical protein
LKSRSAPAILIRPLPVFLNTTCFSKTGSKSGSTSF